MGLQNCAFDHPFEAGGLLWKLVFARPNQWVHPLGEELFQVLSQEVEIGSAVGQDFTADGILEERKEEMLQCQKLVSSVDRLVGSQVERRLQFLGDHTCSLPAHSHPLDEPSWSGTSLSLLFLECAE